jgi:hypothetical protein
MLFFFITPAQAHNSRTLVIFDQNNAQQSAFFGKIQRQLAPHKNIRLQTLDATTVSTKQIKTFNHTLIISLDKQASKQLLSQATPMPIWHALLTIADAHALLPCLPQCGNVAQQHRFFVLDQHPSRQLQLIQKSMPRVKNIGVMYSAASALQVELIHAAAKDHALTVNAYPVDENSLRFKLEEIAQTSDVILALADKSIYNASTLSQILLTTYRNKTPVIGFSKGFIKAGAITGVVSDFEQLAHHLAGVIVSYHKAPDARQNKLVFPKYFQVLSNHNVAKSLNRQFPSDAELTESLE